MHIPRAMKILALLGVILVLGFASSTAPTTKANYSTTDNSRHTFIWISNVTPELAEWANNLSFTDAVVIDNSEQSYLNLASVNITYWHFVTAYGITSTDKERLRTQLIGFTNSSPNGNVYIDDTHCILTDRGLEATNNLLDVIRELQTRGARFILNGDTSNDVTDTTSLFAKTNMVSIDFDAYQPLRTPYEDTLLKLRQGNPNSLGLYIWLFLCVNGGASWDCLTVGDLDNAYGLASKKGITRVIIWNGYSENPGFASCLYDHPEWWEKIKTANMKFLGSNP